MVCQMIFLPPLIMIKQKDIELKKIQTKVSTGQFGDVLLPPFKVIWEKNTAPEQTQTVLPPKKNACVCNSDKGIDRTS